MFPVLDLDPVIAPAAAVGALAVLGDQALQPHQAGVAKQVRPDLALFKWRARSHQVRIARLTSRDYQMTESLSGKIMLDCIAFSA